jgi:hypothetical protein
VLSIKPDNGSNQIICTQKILCPLLIAIRNRSVLLERGSYPGISYKGLRAIYAECQWALLPEKVKAKTSQHRKYSDWLGHIDKDGSIDTTFVSYMVYNVTDIEAVKRQLRKFS